MKPWKCFSSGFDFGDPVVAKLDYDCNTLTCHQEGDIVAAFNVLQTVYAQQSEQLSILRYGKKQTEEFKKSETDNWREHWGLEQMHENIIKGDSVGVDNKKASASFDKGSLILKGGDGDDNGPGQPLIISNSTITTTAHVEQCTKANDLIPFAIIGFTGSLLGVLIFHGIRFVLRSLNEHLYARTQAKLKVEEGPFRTKQS